MTTAGPRIYNLFPSLVGALPDWAGHLPRVEGMGFDWVHLNPIHPTGASGSLYAVRDPLDVNPLFLGGPAPGNALLRGFVDQARRHGVKVMLDLVAGATAPDAPLVARHPEWYRRDARGGLEVAGDLALLDYRRPELWPGLIDYWRGVMRHFIGLGVRGFCCVGAHRVPAQVWRALIDAAREAEPEVVVFAETLGGTMDQVRGLHDAGFDFLFNSAKWWDFKADWLLDQYEAYRWIASTVAFPESHDTDRLAAEVGSQDTERLAAHLKMHYLFAACFSSGVMMPVGYEYGFTRKLDVARTRPDDWERPKLDLTGYIGKVNAMKAAVPALNVEGPQWRATAPGTPVVGLLRTVDGAGGGGAGDGCSVVLVNPDETRSHTVDPGPLLASTGGRFGGFTDVTPEAAPLPFEPGRPLTLKPLEMRVFQGRAENRRPIDLTGEGPQRETASRRRLDELAASRIAIEGVRPEIDGGRFPVKRVVGDVMAVSADIFTDGTFVLGAAVLSRAVDEDAWRAVPMAFDDNDRWIGRVPLARNTRVLYTVEAWRDVWESWRADFVKKHDTGLDVALEIVEGRRFVEHSAALAGGEGRQALERVVNRLSTLLDRDLVDYALADEPRRVMAAHGERAYVSRYPRVLEVVVDRTAARFSSWLEIFPRSASPGPGRHGTFADVVGLLPMVREMGFDVLYFPPIHPIGRTARKGRDNATTAGPDDPGSPYAIGAAEGGHDAIDGQLGTLDDFRHLVRQAERHGVEIALDFAVQCSPDHPWIVQHPEWYYWRPDGSVRTAENPPKKYQDIVNVSFYRDAFPGLWLALRDLVLFWAGEGVRIFRVDNPHTKPLPFWEWLIREVQDRHPDTVFLAEAFTRPKPMGRLAKLGFTQSYSYFTWRNTKAELTEYMTELTATQSAEYLRPNFFVSTPDILPPVLVSGGRAAHLIRSVLAATLSPAWGVYGPCLLAEAEATPGKDEYLHSEKYEIRCWDWDRPGHIRDFIGRLNRIRRDNPALQLFTNLRFYTAWDEHLLFYGKASPARDNLILVVVNLDPHHAHGATIELPLWEWGLADGAHVDVEDLLTGRRFIWTGKLQHIWLDPRDAVCALWRIAPRSV
jgi:starch synthase (maltosyl-transferring)